MYLYPALNSIAINYTDMQIKKMGRILFLSLEK